MNFGVRVHTCATKKGHSPNLLLFSEVNKKSLDSLYQQESSGIDFSTLKTLLYTCDSITIHPNERLNVGLSCRDARDLGLMKPMVINQSIRSIYKHFDRTKPIDFIILTPRCIVDISSPDKLRIQCRNALKRAGVKKAVIFGLDIGKNGEPHFHALVQGYLKPHDVVEKRTGWSYHKEDDDRSRYMEYDEDQPNSKNGVGFYSTARYCLRKPSMHKRAYLKVH